MIAFPPFVRNRKDPLFPLHDAAVHALCLERHPLAPAAMEALRHASARPASCIVCKGAIDGDRPGFCTGLLSSAPESPIHRFNFLCVHLAHYESWVGAPEFEESVSAFLQSSDWDGPTLRFRPHPEWLAEPTEPEARGPKQRVVRRWTPDGREPR